MYAEEVRETYCQDRAKTKTYKAGHLQIVPAAETDQTSGQIAECLDPYPPVGTAA
jgi:hypothetical protein